MRVRVRPWDVRAGDRLVGTDQVVTGVGVRSGEGLFQVRVRASSGRVSRLTFGATGVLEVERAE